MERLIRSAILISPQFANIPVKPDARSRNTPYARAPNYYNEDFSAIRNFHFTESAFLQLKAEFLNAFNRHIFSVPNASPNDANFGVVNGTIDSPRIVQFTLRVIF